MMLRIIVILGFLFSVFLFPGMARSAVNVPNLQERRALQEAQAMQMKKQQEIAIFKKQRDELLINYKSLMQLRNQSQAQMKVAQKDYKTAIERFNQAKQQEQDIENQVKQLRQKTNKTNAASMDEEIKKLRESQAKLIENMKNYSKVQEVSYQSMLAYDDQYRNLAAKEQILRQQIENVQRQLQFVLTQP